MDDGQHPRMVTIIHLSPGSTQPAVHTIRTCFGEPSLGAFPWSLPWGDPTSCPLGEPSLGAFPWSLQWGDNP